MTNNEHNRIRQVLFAEEEDLTQALRIHVCLQICWGTVSKTDVGELSYGEMS